MNNAIDTTKLRALAAAADVGGYGATAAALREAAQTIDDLRAACAALGPCVPERLTRYRCALVVAHPLDGSRNIEDEAHDMLRAEREPEPR